MYLSESYEIDRFESNTDIGTNQDLQNKEGHLNKYKKIRHVNTLSIII